MDPNILNSINNLYETYKDQPYILNRIQGYISNLPNWLITDLSNYEKRVHRTNELTLEYDTFCKVDIH